jgi:hypothetical protein
LSTLASVVVRDLIANRPAASIPGRMFYTTDSGAAGQIFRDNGASWDFVGMAENISQSFTAQTSVTVTHNLGTLSVMVQVYDNNGYQIIPASIQTTDVNNVVVTFAVAQDGLILVRA